MMQVASPGLSLQAWRCAAIALVVFGSACTPGTPGAKALKTLSTSDPGPLKHETPLKAEQILEGHPVTHTDDVFQSGDGQLFVAYWSATAGRFTWDYHHINEVITVLDGEAFVKTSDGTTHHLLPGVTVSFAEGDHAEWTVPQYIRKVAVVQLSPPSFSTRIRRRLSRLLH